MPHRLGLVLGGVLAAVARVDTHVLAMHEASVVQEELGLAAPEVTDPAAVVPLYGRIWELVVLTGGALHMGTVLDM